MVVEAQDGIPAIVLERGNPGSLARNGDVITGRLKLGCACRYFLPLSFRTRFPRRRGLRRAVACLGEVEVASIRRCVHVISPFATLSVQGGRARNAERRARRPSTARLPLLLARWLCGFACAPCGHC